MNVFAIGYLNIELFQKNYGKNGTFNPKRASVHVSMHQMYLIILEFRPISYNN